MSCQFFELVGEDAAHKEIPLVDLPLVLVPAHVFIGNLIDQILELNFRICSLDAFLLEHVHEMLEGKVFIDQETSLVTHFLRVLLVDIEICLVDTSTHFTG